MTPSTSEEVRVATARPPRELLIGALGCVLIGAALLLPDTAAASVAGYIISSFVTIGLLAAFQRVDVSRRNRAGYIAQPWLRRLSPALAAAGIVIASVHVWRIATGIAG
jgi:hypothetical protein